MNNFDLDYLAFHQSFGEADDYYDLYIKLNDELDKKLSSDSILCVLKTLEHSYRYRNKYEENDTMNGSVKKFKKSNEFKLAEFHKVISFLKLGINSVFDEIDVLKMYVFNAALFKFYLQFLKDDIKNNFKINRVLNFSGFLQSYGSQLISDILREMNTYNNEFLKTTDNLSRIIDHLEAERDKMEKRIIELERKIL